jgi:restriction endonuclease Mrr
VSDDKPYHYPPELLSLLVDVVPLLCRSKTDVVNFLRAGGTPGRVLAPIQQQLENDRSSVNKYEIVRKVLKALNEQGDSAIQARRQILRQVVEFEQFSVCWPNDQLKARGLVAEVRSLVNVKDSFTRIEQERERERRERVERPRADQKLRLELAQRKQELHADLSRLYSAPDPRQRGHTLECLLNELFKLDGLLIRESFVLRRDDGQAQEQIDGVIEYAGDRYLVEVKWWNDPLGVDAVSRHLVRVYGRAGVGGLFISASGYARPAIEECQRALTQRVFVLAELSELILLLERRGDLAAWMRDKVRKATIERMPLFRPGVDA